MTTTLDAHVEMFPELLCARSEACGPQPGFDFDTCLSQQSWSEEDVADFKALEEQGIATFDSKESDTCIEAIVLHECPPVISEEQEGPAGIFDIPECDNVITYQAAPL